MAANLSAILSIAAKVTGEGAVNAMTGAVNKLENTSKMATGTLKGLAGSAGGLGSALGVLAPLLSVGGLVAMANNSLQAAAGLYDLSQKTGVSVVMLAKFKKAASMTGTDIDTVARGLIKLQKNMAAAAAETGFARKTKEEIDAAIYAIREGERRQTEIIKRQADERIAALEDESDRRMREISKRYRREEQLLNDKWSDQDDIESKAADKRLAAQIEAADKEYEIKKKTVEDITYWSEEQRTAVLDSMKKEQDAKLEALRDAAASEAKQRKRDARDEEQAVLDKLNDKRQAEEKAIKDAAKAKEQILKDAADRQAQIVKKTADDAAKALKVDPSENALSQQLEEMGLSGAKAAEIFRKLGLSVKDSKGNLKDAGAMALELATKIKSLPPNSKLAVDAMNLLGKSGFEMRQFLMLGGKAIDDLKVSMDEAYAKSAKEYQKSLVSLNGKVGALAGSLAKLLLPAMNEIVWGTTQLAGLFSKMPGWAQKVVGAIVVLSIGLSLITPVILTIIGVVGTVAGAFGVAFATIAGYLGAFIPFVEFVTTIAAGIGTVIALIGGWPLLIGAALIAIGALLYSFRDKIGAFAGAIVQAMINGLSALPGIAAKAWSAISTRFTTYVSRPISKAWSSLVGFLGTALSNVTSGISKLWNGVADGAKNAFRGVAYYVVGTFNGVIAAIDAVIDVINVARGEMNMEPIAKIPFLNVPQFAEGGVVSRPTLAMVGEGGQAEYIIPASKMAAASSNYLAGSRGASVITGGGSKGSAAPQINIQTGPVMQTADGQQWVSIGDLERAQRQTVAAVMGQLRTPAGRYAVGAR